MEVNHLLVVRSPLDHSERPGILAARERETGHSVKNPDFYITLKPYTKKGPKSQLKTDRDLGRLALFYKYKTKAKMD
jgi:hypothetical protein